LEEDVVEDTTEGVSLVVVLSSDGAAGDDDSYSTVY
jgi:hypothetical protein